MGIEQRNVDRDPPTGASCELVAVQLEASTLVGTSCYWYSMDRVDGATVAVAAPTAIDNCTAWACHLALRLHPAAVMFVSTPVVVTGDGATRAGQGADRWGRHEGSWTTFACPPPRSFMATAGGPFSCKIHAVAAVWAGGSLMLSGKEQVMSLFFPKPLYAPSCFSSSIGASSGHLGDEYQRNTPSRRISAKRRSSASYRGHAWTRCPHWRQADTDMWATWSVFSIKTHSTRRLVRGISWSTKAIIICKKKLKNVVGPKCDGLRNFLSLYQSLAAWPTVDMSHQNMNT